MRDLVIQKTIEGRIIAIVRGMEESLILPLAEALLAGGIGMVEVTFNQTKPETFESTARAIKALKDNFDGKIIPGAGTVVTPEQAEMAASAGAQYIISPNVNIAVIKRTRELGLVSMPGAMTPSEAMTAHESGADFIKLFPAGTFGTGYLKAIRAPLSHLRFLAVGGIDEKNAADFIRAGALGLGIGGNLVNKDWIAAGEFDKITTLAAKLVETAHSA